MQFFYFEAGNYCGIREFKSLKEAEEEILKEVGWRDGCPRVQHATATHAAWVGSMGGYVPEEFKPYVDKEKKRKEIEDNEHKLIKATCDVLKSSAEAFGAKNVHVSFSDLGFVVTLDVPGVKKSKKGGKDGSRCRVARGIDEGPAQDWGKAKSVTTSRKQGKSGNVQRGNGSSGGILLPSNERRHKGCGCAGTRIKSESCTDLDPGCHHWGRRKGDKGKTPSGP